MVALLLAWAWVVEVVQAFCPPGCTCDDSAPSARCINVGVNMVPILFNPYLRRLNMARNSISNLGGNLVWLDKLEDLDFSHNLIKILSNGDFEKQANLRELKLSHNQLTTISMGAFRGLKKLTVLDISHNSLVELREGVMDDIPQLLALHLSHNRLHILTPHTFKSLRLLQVLDLCDNYFRHVPTAALEDLISLLSLSLCRNRLTSLPSLAFPTDSLTRLSLETNSIEFIHDVAFLRLQYLTHLSLDGNILSQVPSGALAPLISLESLYLSKNKISYVGPGAFIRLGNLSTLQISRSPHLVELHPEALYGCKNLLNLTISHNPLLQKFPSGFFYPLEHIKNVDLRANGLHTFDEMEVKFRYLWRLDLRENPVVCNCSMKWLASFLSSSNTTIKVPDVQCAAPEKYRGHYLSRLAPSAMCNERFEVVVSVVIISICFVLALTLSLMVCRYIRSQQRSKCSSDWRGGPPFSPWQSHDHHRRAPPFPTSAPPAPSVSSLADETGPAMGEDFFYSNNHPIVKIPISDV